MPYSIESLATKNKASLKNLTFYELNGQGVVRSKPFPRYYKYSSLQVQNSLSIKPLISLFNKFKPLLYYSLNDRPVNLSAYQYFFKLNLNTSIVSGSFDYNLLRFTSNSFESTVFTLIPFIDSLYNYKITWSDDSDPNKLSSDILCYAFISSDSDIVHYKITSYTRSSLEAFIEHLDFNKNDNLFLYIFFVRNDFSLASEPALFNFSFIFPIEFTEILYGYLYNWDTINHPNFCPSGWKIPTISEFDTLANSISAISTAGGHMKTTGTNLWNSPNTSADNSSLFNSKPAGYIDSAGSYGRLQKNNYFWTLTTGSDNLRYHKYCYYNNANLNQSTFSRYYGLSARLLKLDDFDQGYLVDYDGNYYTTKKYGNQVWTTENFRCMHLNDGTSIPYVEGGSTWAALRDIGRTAYQNSYDYI